MTKKQIEFLRIYIDTMFMIAKMFQESENFPSMRVYASQGRDGCKRLIAAQKDYDRDITDIYNFAA